MISALSRRLLLVTGSVFLALATSSCFFSSREVETGETFAYERRNYFRDTLLSDGGLSFESENFLQGNLLMSEAQTNPEKILRELREQYEVSSDGKYLAIAADYCRWMASASDEETAVRFALTAFRYIRDFMLLETKSNAASKEHDIQPFQMALCYNECAAIIFEYLQNHDLLDHDAFLCKGIEGKNYCFEKPVYRLSVPRESLQNFSLCSHYSVKNLMLKNRRGGLGVPLVGTLKEKQFFHSLRTPAGLTIPVTMLIRVLPGKDSVENVRLVFIDTTLQENFTAELLNNSQWKLALDFSTPLACFLGALPERNLISGMLHADTADKTTGLYMVEPYNPKKIPVLFVHGLMSSPETWIQMINSLKNDPVIREKYQFWFYSYSSGTPIIASGAGLRQTLLNVQKELCTTPEATEKFNQMVIVGHSMGGLLTKMTIQQDPYYLPEHLAEMPLAQLQKEMSAEENKVLEKYLILQPLPFVRRVIFMAVPHRGAKMAQSPIGQLGVLCTQLPTQIMKDFSSFRKFVQGKKDSPLQKKITDHAATGIDGLDPDNPLLKTLSQAPLKKDLPFHCIIGNTAGDDQPGGSDGVVPYTSSHLDGAKSELVVKSGHSVHRTPQAIREVLRILRLHLTQKK